MESTGIIALILGTGWASGVNLYAAILTLGIMSATGTTVLPPGLQVLEHPLVLGAAAVMYFLEFWADKIPAIDSGWDAIHTFIRIPAGILMAYGATEGLAPEVQMAAAILGGGLATLSHTTKAGTRVIVNTSPEPVSNWTLSILEDVAVIGGLWTALNYPVLFIGVALLGVLLMIWLIPKIFRGIKRVFLRLKSFFSPNAKQELLLLEYKQKKGDTETVPPGEGGV